MKVTRDPAPFVPFTLRVETPEELVALRLLIHHSAIFTRIDLKNALAGEEYEHHNYDVESVWAAMVDLCNAVVKGDS